VREAGVLSKRARKRARYGADVSNAQKKIFSTKTAKTRIACAQRRGSGSGAVIERAQRNLTSNTDCRRLRQRPSERGMLSKVSASGYVVVIR